MSPRKACTFVYAIDHKPSQNSQYFITNFQQWAMSFLEFATQFAFPGNFQVHVYTV